MNKTDDKQDLDPADIRRVLRVGPYEDLRTIESAAKFAKDGDIVEIQAGEYYGDVAIWRQKKLTIRARGGKARIYAEGKSAQGKGIWVIQDGDFYVENIEFVGAHVYDHNGAGIRFEGGTLFVKNCLFYGNDTGLLTTDSADSLVIESSEFAYNGYGDGYSHNLYVGKMRSLKITGSYFHHVNVGHGIKSRAQNNHIYYNRITDESGGRASYEVDLPNGGIAYLVGNIIQQDVTPQNSAIITYGAEGVLWPENQLYLASNTLVNDHPYGGTFVRSAPGTQSLVSINNLWVGLGKVFDGQPNVQTQNDIRTDWSAFVQASRLDYRLGAKGLAWSYAVPVLPELAPAAEYLAPLQVRPLVQKPTRPGALQTQ
nr:right-handed parallel beta-helix repeat-containing protein [Rhodoferax sp. U11-2br]